MRSAYGEDSSDLRLESIHMYTLFGLGVSSLRVKRIYINNFHILPIDNHWLSANMEFLAPHQSQFNINSLTFIHGNLSQSILHSTNAKDLSFINNYIQINLSIPLITICNSDNSTVIHNCVVNDQTKIDQYYQFYKSYLCFEIFSHDIHLPPSAFNSSFPPHV